jgi:FkbM family methyltransferase
MWPITQRIVDTVLRRAGLFSALNWKARVTVADQTFFAPTICGIRVDPSEPWMVDVLSRLLTFRSDAVIDVGVNLGQTLLKIKALDPPRHYVGFEPNVACVNYVEKLIQANDLQNCIVVPVGLAPKADILTLDLFGGDADSAASLIPNFRPNQTVKGQKSVAVMSLAELPSEIVPEAVALVKIDVEGAELDVLQALLPVVKRDRPFIVIEILPSYSTEWVERVRRQKEIEEYLRNLDYVLLRIIRDQTDVLEKLELIEEIEIHSEMAFCDYIACPSEAASEVRANF